MGWNQNSAIPKAKVSNVFRVNLEEVFIKGRQGNCDKDSKEAWKTNLAS